MVRLCGFKPYLQCEKLMAGRYGGGKVHMEKELNPIRNYFSGVYDSQADRCLRLGELYVGSDLHGRSPTNIGCQPAEGP